jgi:hypothetical protein
MLIAGLAVAALFAWRGYRYWSLVLAIVLAVQTWAFARGFVSNVLFVPEHWTYFKSVFKSALARGLDGGPLLIWSLVVIPLGLARGLQRS